MFGNEMVPKKPGMLKGAQKLRSFLLLDGQRNITKLSKHFFLSFKSIRALDCSGSHIKKLSNSVGTLLHLRYLNLSHTLLKTLPKSICCLLHLEALILKQCNHLTQLPAEIRNNTAGSDISELQRLDLHGELMIKNLENLSNDICAKNANLKGKKHIRFLKLIWEQVEDMETRENVERVVESLQPNSDLRKLHIEGYIGANFPSWSMTTYLVHIVELSLLKCHSYGEMDSATHFASLKQLTLRNMPCLLECISKESQFRDRLLRTWDFEVLVHYGCHNIILEKGIQSLQFLQYASLSDCRNLTTLPMTMQHLTSLRTLHIWSCSEMCMLPEWLGDLVSVRELELWYCENLSSLPESVKKLTKLQFLSIWGCPNLGLRCKKDVGEDWHNIKHVPFIKINDPYIQAMTGVTLTIGILVILRNVLAASSFSNPTTIAVTFTTI
ncbi:hypothetical protein CQW23_02151 [Capsicum baccatum]|uniref:R13L1/DRL21-like LRR repeat region domain-containing protein n=1 Tax=Capsicum baccatum TaxID=33114 RepID=A0A2G2XQM7_CAPBA|nr:hypothetical protein CQW23_02151 [Capsicum baccatum]